MGVALSRSSARHRYRRRSRAYPMLSSKHTKFCIISAWRQVKQSSSAVARWMTFEPFPFRHGERRVISLTKSKTDTSPTTGSP